MATFEVSPQMRALYAHERIRHLCDGDRHLTDRSHRAFFPKPPLRSRETIADVEVMVDDIAIFLVGGVANKERAADIVKRLDSGEDVRSIGHSYGLMAKRIFDIADLWRLEQTRD